MTSARMKTRLEKLEAVIPAFKKNLCLLGASQADFDEQLAKAGNLEGIEITKIWLVGPEAKQ